MSFTLGGGVHGPPGKPITLSGRGTMLCLEQKKEKKKTHSKDVADRPPWRSCTFGENRWAERRVGQRGEA